jgi:hypothetical protein
LSIVVVLSGLLSSLSIVVVWYSLLSNLLSSLLSSLSIVVVRSSQATIYTTANKVASTKILLLQTIKLPLLPKILLHLSLSLPLSETLLHSHLTLPETLLQLLSLPLLPKTLLQLLPPPKTLLHLHLPLLLPKTTKLHLSLLLQTTILLHLSLLPDSRSQINRMQQQAQMTAFSSALGNPQRILDGISTIHQENPRSQVPFW